MIPPGVFFHDPNFKFKDGQSGNKLFIVLTDGASGYYVVARTTSNPDRRSRGYGCHLDDAYPNFFIPLEAKCFNQDTWVCLDYLSDLRCQDFHSDLSLGHIRQLGKIGPLTLKDLLCCVEKSEDITLDQAALLAEILAGL